MARNEMGGDWQYYRLEKRLDNIEDLMGEILRRLGSLEYSGVVNGEEYNIKLDKKNRWDKLQETMPKYDGDGKKLV